MHHPLYSPAPTPTAPQPTTQTIKKPMPLGLLEAYSSLFNDPLYSDICFKIIRCHRHRDGTSEQKGNSNLVVRRLYASKKILIRRGEYFSTMFGSGFWDRICHVLAASWLEIYPGDFAQPATLTVLKAFNGLMV
ncbi:hypothetical protein PtB15_9B538 [Puccinia triticina]|nr:hypothetical protein PtB15_9B538 [Puccinia triticina]